MYNKLKKIKTAIFISGRGSNMESLIRATNNKKLPAIIVLVITDNEFAPGIQLAKNYKIATKILDKPAIIKKDNDPIANPIGNKSKPPKIPKLWSTYPVTSNCIKRVAAFKII